MEIAGQTGAQYQVRAADVGRRLRSQVTACNSDGCSAALSAASPIVSARAAPQNTRAPTVAFLDEHLSGRTVHGHEESSMRPWILGAGVGVALVLVAARLSRRRRSPAQTA